MACTFYSSITIWILQFSCRNIYLLYNEVKSKQFPAPKLILNKNLAYLHIFQVDRCSCN